jgi:uncharacterized RDD family membrane protein YckC
VIRICSKCGALLLDDSENCSFCNAPPEERSDVRAPAAVSAAAADDAGEPEWRVEVSRRLEQYRARRGHIRGDESQSGLPFQNPSAAIDVDIDDEIRERPRSRPAPRQRQSERVEIRVQSELDFSSAPDDRVHPQTALVPVASLASRRWAGVIDLLFLGLTYAAFLGLFLVASKSAGGRLTFGKVDAGVYFSVAYLFYALYFSLFITFAGATPGMQILGLYIVRLDGSLPETRQLLWRSFGYLLSGATLALGFLWALWDEDRFTWQDRISQTYITAAAPLSDGDSLGISAEHTFAHK